jgi:hypothetical protein
MDALMAGMFGKQQGIGRGRGGSVHAFDAATRFYGGNAIVGGGRPMAVGLALADQLLGRTPVTACFFVRVAKPIRTSHPSGSRQWGCPRWGGKMPGPWLVRAPENRPKKAADATCAMSR